VSTLPVSCFGKLPFHREFLRIGLGTPGAASVVRWVDGAHAAWSRSGDPPAETPLVRFAMATEHGGVVAGVVRQSSDGLRRHPVAFFIEDPARVARADWPLLPLALAGPWTELSALSARSWDDHDALTGALAAGTPALDWEAARAARREALAAPCPGSPWEALTGVRGDDARHVAANLLAVAEAQRAARSTAEGVSVALPLPPDPGLAPSRASLWLELLDLAAGMAESGPAIALRDTPPRLVAFYRPPEGPDLAAVLSSLDMAPIDDLAEAWQTLPAAGSERARAVDALVGTAATGALGDLPGRLGNAAAT
jgi:hypothetical protein